MGKDELYVPQKKTRRVEWIDAADPDGTPFVVKVQSAVTFGERNTLVFDPDTKMTEVHDLLAPFVVGWNLGEPGSDGQPVPVPAPAASGGAAFEKVPNELFWYLWNDIRAHALQRLDPTSRSSAESADAPTDEAN